MKLKTSKLRSAIILALVAVPVSMPLMAQEEGDDATRLDTITVTGSRIKRADVEGALPVVVIDRAQIEASGTITVADFLRDTTFNSFGAYMSSSGSSGLGATQVSMRGLGAARTLILIDGRRAPVAPQLGQGQDLNSIPLAAVERFEILSDGASAVYGSDAIGGVINIITRKDYNGVQLSYGMGRPSNDGGDTEEGSVIIGTSNDRGRVLAGASYSERDIIFNRDRDYWYWGPNSTTSTFSNNFTQVNNSAAVGNRLRHPTFGTTVPGLCANGESGFWMAPITDEVTGENISTCQYDHASVSATISSSKQNAIFARGDYEINEDWTFYFDTSTNKSTAFGRYAPVPSSPFPGGSIRLVAGSPNHPGTAPEDGGLNPNYDDYYAQFAGQDLFLFHRFAALGNRDSYSEVTTSNYAGGLRGMVGNVELDFGARYNESRGWDKGENYVVGGLAQAPITSGAYNIYDPYAGDPNGLGFTTTILRDLKTSTKEIYGSAAFDLFSMGGGSAAMVVGAEYREEFYQDNYDPLSESGQVVGSAGNSAAGDRDVKAAYFEVLFPITSTFEVDIAGRYDEYSDYGSDFAPKVSMRWQPLESLTLRGSYGEGFRAPTLDILTAKPSFSADDSTDSATCMMLTGQSNCSTQISTWRISNPDLTSEQSEQFSLGVVWDATDWLNMSLDYYNIKITDQIAFIGSVTITQCLRGTRTDCPTGLSYLPAGTSATAPNPGVGLGLELDPTAGGIVLAQTGYTNLGSVETEGYDFTARTNFDLGNFGSLRNQLMISYMADQHTNDNPSYVGQPGAPRIRAGLQNIWSISDFEVSWNISYIHHTHSWTYRDWLADNTWGEPAGYSFDEYNEGLVGKTMPSYVSHDIQFSYNAPWDATVTLGVRNALDREPSMDNLYRYYQADSVDIDLYDVWGRVPYFRYTQRF